METNFNLYNPYIACSDSVTRAQSPWGLGVSNMQTRGFGVSPWPHIFPSQGSYRCCRSLLPLTVRWVFFFFFFWGGGGEMWSEWGFWGVRWPQLTKLGNPLELSQFKFDRREYQSNRNWSLTDLLTLNGKEALWLEDRKTSSPWDCGGNSAGCKTGVEELVAPCFLKC